MNGALGGWTISQNFFARSGLPFTVIDGNVTIANYAPLNPIGPGSWDRQGELRERSEQCLAFNHFGTATTAFPNQTRNGFRGPGFFDSDFTINKNFKLTERFAFGIGANFYNIFNHPNFTNPDNNCRWRSRAGRYLRPDPHHHRAADRPVRSIRTRSAFGAHYPVPGQAGVLKPPQLMAAAPVREPLLFARFVNRHPERSEEAKLTNGVEGRHPH